jgi:hypothetical protein
MKIKQLIKELKKYDENNEVFVAIFFPDKRGEISDIESLCWNNGVQINIDSERGEDD